MTAPEDEPMCPPYKPTSADILSRNAKHRTAPHNAHSATARKSTSKTWKPGFWSLPKLGKLISTKTVF